MALPTNIVEKHVKQAIEKIDEEGIPTNAHSSTYDLAYEGKYYPPKLVLSWANIFANGSELDRSTFDGGEVSSCFKLLRDLGFTIAPKVDSIFDIYSQFLEDVNKGTLKTAHYPKKFRGLTLKVSFGQGNLAKIPWLAILKPEQKVSEGIYPVLLYYKEFDLVILAFGESEENKATWRWKTAAGESISEYLNSQYGADPSRYSQSKIHSLFDPKVPVDQDKLLNAINDILEHYAQIEPINKNDVQSPKAEYKTMPQHTALNQILYGPPGTGKTYLTVQKAVDAAEPNFVPSGETRDEIRSAYKAKYDELVVDERIRFVTFHQSYGYEEFVEGLSAKTEGDQLSYFEKDGIFKAICDDAKPYRLSSKATITNKFDERWQQFAETLAESETGIQVKTISHKTYFTVTDLTNNTIRFDKSKGNSVHTLSVKTLKAIYNKEKVIKGGLKPYYVAMIEHLEQIPASSSDTTIERKHFVLIIDEINRGNISKIFGELITLIEPSKRLGEPESLQVVLPYSGDAFSVPDNLYIIGTMNTADRSLALMDTALRRRFDFVEMMPDYSVLHDEGDMPYSIVQNKIQINLVTLLQTLNKRIAALYDREHTLGHAFLMPVVEKIKADDHQSALVELAMSFKNKIIPLLAEYFFEDWQKIRLVLGDNQKEKLKHAPLIEKLDVEFESLFGDTDDLELIDDEVHDYRLVSADSRLWGDPLTYVGIYDVNLLVE
jgi:5-methylcytosine-specific restriction protein B